MNPLELACSKGLDEMVNLFVNTLGLKSKADLNPKLETLPLEQLPFIYLPIVQKDPRVFEILLSLSHLWSLEQLRQMAGFLKEVKWREGFQILLRSTSVHHQYKRLSMPDRLRFIQDSLMVPYELCYFPTGNDEDAIPDDCYLLDGFTKYAYGNNMNAEEIRLVYLTIKDCLCEMPFACGMVL